MLKYPLSYIRVTHLDPMKIVNITNMISYSLNGHALLSSRAESGFYLYVLCVMGWIAESMQMCRLVRPFAYHQTAMKQRKFRAHLLRVQRCLHLAYSSTNSFSTAHSLLTQYWHRHKKARFCCVPITKAQNNVRIHAD